MNDSIGGPCCAHLVVEYVTEAGGCGTVRGWWKCRTCDCAFTPLVAATPPAPRACDDKRHAAAVRLAGYIEPHVTEHGVGPRQVGSIGIESKDLLFLVLAYRATLPAEREGEAGDDHTRQYARDNVEHDLARFQRGELSATIMTARIEKLAHIVAHDVVSAALAAAGKERA